MHFVGNQALTIHLQGEDKGISLSYGVGYTVLSLIVAVLAMILAFAFIGLRFDSRKGHHGRLQERESQLEKFDPEGQFDLDPAPHSEAHKADDALQPVQTGEGENKRFSWSMAKGASTVVDLPGKRPRPASHGSSFNKQNFDDASSDDNEFDQGGDFGINPAGLSLASIAKILIAGIISGGGVASMREPSASLVPQSSERSRTDLVFFHFVLQTTSGSSRSTLCRGSGTVPTWWYCRS